MNSYRLIAAAALFGCLPATAVAVAAPSSNPQITACGELAEDGVTYDLAFSNDSANPSPLFADACLRVTGDNVVINIPPGGQYLSWPVPAEDVGEAVFLQVEGDNFLLTGEVDPFFEGGLSLIHQETEGEPQRAAVLLQVDGAVATAVVAPVESSSIVFMRNAPSNRTVPVVRIRDAEVSFRQTYFQDGGAGSIGTAPVFDITSSIVLWDSGSVVQADASTKPLVASQASALELAGMFLSPKGPHCLVPGHAAADALTVDDETFCGQAPVLVLDRAEDVQVTQAIVAATLANAGAGILGELVVLGGEDIILDGLEAQSLVVVGTRGLLVQDSRFCTRSAISSQCTASGSAFGGRVLLADVVNAMVEHNWLLGDFEVRTPVLVVEGGASTVLRRNLLEGSGDQVMRVGGVVPPASLHLVQNYIANRDWFGGGLLVENCSRCRLEGDHLVATGQLLQVDGVAGIGTGIHEALDLFDVGLSSMFGGTDLVVRDRVGGQAAPVVNFFLKDRAVPRVQMRGLAFGRTALVQALATDDSVTADVQGTLQTEDPAACAGDRGECVLVGTGVFEAQPGPT